MLSINIAALGGLVASATAAAYVSSLLVQLIKDSLIDPRMPDGAARVATIRSITYLLNFVLLAGIVISQGAWDWSLIIVYVGLALDQTIVSHLGFKTLTRSSGGTVPAPVPPLEMNGDQTPPSGS